MGKKKSKKGYRQQATAWGDGGTMPLDNGAYAAGAYASAPDANAGMLHSLQGLMGSRTTEQFILGAVIGAAAVYVLGDEEMRSKLMKGVMKLYSGVAGGFEEMKEQMADIKAEVAAEKRSGV